MTQPDVRRNDDLWAPERTDWRRYRRLSLGLAIGATVLIMIGLSVAVLVYSPGVADSAKAAFDLSFGDKAYYLLWAGVFVAAGAVLCIWSFRTFRQEARDYQKQIDVLAGEGKAALRAVEAMGPLTRR